MSYPKATLSIAVLLVGSAAIYAAIKASTICQVREYLGNIPGIRIASVGGVIVIDGEISSPRDMLRIHELTQGLQSQNQVAVRNLTQISEATRLELIETIQRQIGSPDITVRFVNQSLYLEGVAESDFDADRAVELAKSFSASPVPIWGNLLVVDMLKVSARKPASGKK